MLAATMALEDIVAPYGRSRDWQHETSPRVAPLAWMDDQHQPLARGEWSLPLTTLDPPSEELYDILSSLSSEASSPSHVAAPLDQPIQLQPWLLAPLPGGEASSDARGRDLASDSEPASPSPSASSGDAWQQPRAARISTLHATHSDSTDDWAAVPATLAPAHTRRLEDRSQALQCEHCGGLSPAAASQRHGRGGSAPRAAGRRLPDASNALSVGSPLSHPAAAIAGHEAPDALGRFPPPTYLELQRFLEAELVKGVTGALDPLSLLQLAVFLGAAGSAGGGRSGAVAAFEAHGMENLRLLVTTAEPVFWSCTDLFQLPGLRRVGDYGSDRAGYYLLRLRRGGDGVKFNWQMAGGRPVHRWQMTGTPKKCGPGGRAVWLERQLFSYKQGGANVPGWTMAKYGLKVGCHLNASVARCMEELAVCKVEFKKALKERFTRPAPLIEGASLGERRKRASPAASPPHKRAARARL